MGDKGTTTNVTEVKSDNWKGIPLPPPTPSVSVPSKPLENFSDEQTWYMSSDVTAEEARGSFPPPVSPYDPCERKGRVDFFWDGLDQQKDELLRNVRKRPLQGNWMCGFCFQWTKTKEELVEHMKTIHENVARFYVCSICRSRFAAKFLLQRHVETHKYQPKYPHTNYVNSQGIPMKELMVGHHYLYGVKPGRPTQETIADALETFTRLSSAKTYRCIECDKEYETFEQVEEHYTELHAMIICKLCKETKRPKTYPCFSDLKTHLIEVHQCNSLEYYWDGYARVWKWIAADRRFHIRRRSAVKFFHPYARSVSKMPWILLKKFQVAARQAKFDAAARRNNNDASAANNSIPNSVEIEEKSDLSAEDVLMNGHAEKEVEKVEDEVPETVTREEEARGGTFTNRSRKKGVPRRPCYICKKLIIYSAFDRHMEAHVSELKFACNLPGCKKRFLTHNSLLLHSRAHSVDRVHKCPHCSRAYNYGSLLKRHMRIHTGEMPYECNMCGKRFHELVSLNYHKMKIHTGERPHRCNLCAKAFILASDLKKHTVMHSKASALINVSQKEVDMDLDVIAEKMKFILDKATNGQINQISQEDGGTSQTTDGLSSMHEESDDEIQCEVVTGDLPESSAL